MISLNSLSSKNKSVLADFAILFSAILWGGDYILAKRALEVVPPGYLNAFRFSVCALIMIVFVRKKVRGMNLRDLLIGALTGVMMFGGFIGQTTGLMHTSVGNNAFLTSSYVIIVPFIAWGLTRIRPKSNNFLGVFLCIAGVGFLTLQGGLSLSKGDAITIMGAVFFGFELALLGIYAKKIDPLALAFVEAATVGILFWIYALFFETAPVSIDRDIMLSIAYITFFGSVLTHIIVTVALKYTSSSHGAILCSTEAVFGLILAAVFLGERLNSRGWIGCTLVLAAVLVTELGEDLVRWKRKESLSSLSPDISDCPGTEKVERA